MIKRICLILIAFVLSVCMLTACGKKEKADETPEAATQATSDTAKPKATEPRSEKATESDKDAQELPFIPKEK